MRKYTKEELMKEHQNEELVETLMQLQETFYHHAGFIESITTTDDELLDAIEEDGRALEDIRINDYDLLSYLVWLDGIDFAIDLNECKIGKRYVSFIKNIEEGTYVKNEENGIVEETKDEEEKILFYDEAEADSVIEQVNDVNEVCYTLIEI